MNREVLEKWKRNLVAIETKVEKLNNDKNILINLLDEIKVKRNIKLNILLKDLELEEELSTFKGWIEFEEEKISRLRNKITELEKEVLTKEIEARKEKEELRDLTEAKEIGKEEIEIEEEKESTEELFKFISKEFEKEPVKEEKEQIKEKPIEKEIIQEKEIPEIKVEEQTVEEDKKADEQEIDEEVLEQQLEDLEKEPKEIFEKKEVEHKKEFDESLAKDIPTKVELEKEKEVRQQVKELFVEKEIIKKPIKLKEKFEFIRKPIRNIFDKTKKFDGQKLIGKTLKLKEKLVAIKEPVRNVFDKARKLERQKIIKYALPAILLVFFVSVLFVSKPEITGYVVLTEEKTFDDNLNLIINKSGNYTWTIDQIGDIESIRASGRTIGNGTVKIYVEKDGERFLIYDNKANSS